MTSTILMCSARLVGVNASPSATPDQESEAAATGLGPALSKP